MRRKAGEKLMDYDDALHKELLKYGLDINGHEFGLNSMYLMTEPSVCKSEIQSYIEEQLGCKLGDD